MKADTQAGRNSIGQSREYTLQAAVLAGGASSRMGQNKVLLEYQGRRFLDRICHEMSDFGEPLISVATKQDYHGEYADLGLPIVYDERHGIGPIEGIYQVLRHAKGDYVFVCAGDMPFVTAELVRYMAEFISSDYDCYVMVDDDHIHPLCAIYSKAVLGVVEELIEAGQYRLMQILRRVRTKYIRIESSSLDKKQLRNINTREEYRRLVLPVVFCVSGIKDSGKTGLIIKLINEFIREEYSVGVIKHDGHEYTMDTEGTDTFRFSEAGAKKSVIFSKSKYSLNHNGAVGVEELISLMKDIDVVVIEGMKASAYPKVEVVRSAVSQHTVCAEETLIAVASDCISPDEAACPVYGLDDIAGIYACVKKYFGLLEEL